MSTPSEKNTELVELSDYLTRQEREQVSAETEHPVESESDLPRSPYAPKRAAERDAARLRVLANKRNDEPRKPAPIEIRRRIMADEELARIEASLRLLQRRQNAGMRLPRGPNLPLPGHSGIGAAAGASDSNDARVLEWLARPRSLEPTLMPPPPLKPARNHRHVSLIIAIACLGGSAAYYAFMPAPSLQSAANTEINTITSVTPSYRARSSYSQGSSALEALSQPEPEWQESTSRGSGTQIEIARIDTSEPSTLSPAEMISARHSLAKAQPADEEAAVPRPTHAVPALEPEAIDLLIEQGERFMADGDIVTARLIFERAANAENATAALALAAAYDPLVLSKLGVLGVDTDVEKARLRYQKAQSLGSAEALNRLRALAER